MEYNFFSIKICNYHIHFVYTALKLETFKGERTLTAIKNIGRIASIVKDQGFIFPAD